MLDTVGDILAYTGDEKMSNLPARVEMERAYKRSDPNYDGIFFLGVRTTGIFCR